MRSSAGLLVAALLALSETASARPGNWRRDDLVDTLLSGGPTKSGSTVHIRKLPKPGSAGVLSSTVALRYDTRDFFKDPKNVNLFVLALEAMQKLPESEDHPLSFFQLGKIHSAPFNMTWDNVGPVADRPPVGGYCRHGEQQFPTWHRPYVALYEQAVWDQIQAIAKTFTGKDKEDYVNAGRAWRLPYWDWAADSSIPAVMMQPKYTVTRPNGKTEEITNPLHSYVFHTASGHTLKEELDSIPNRVTHYSEMGQTMRYPVKGPDGKWATNDTAANEAMTMAQTTIRTATFRLLAGYNDYDKFSNHISTPSDDETNLSLEGIHDNIHGTVGGANGFMAATAVAAYDPIFWLHHCNVDRIFAIWQAIHPDSYLVESTAMGNYAVSPGSKETADSPLKPFHAVGGDDDWWTAANSRDTKNFGYGYPDIEKFPGQSGDKLSASVMKLMSQMYFNQTAANLLKGIDFTDDTGRSLGDGAPDKDVYRDYTVNIDAPQDALNGPYTINVFLGDVTADSVTTKFFNDPNYVGSFSVFTRADNDMAMGSIIGGTVSLTDALLNRVQNGQLENFRTSVVKQFVDANLKYRVVANNGTVVNSVDGLALNVISTLVRATDGGSVTFGTTRGVQEVPLAAGNPNADSSTTDPAPSAPAESGSDNGSDAPAPTATETSEPVPTASDAPADPSAPTDSAESQA